MISPPAPEVVAARAVSATGVAVELSDGQRGVFDVAPFLDYPAFAGLRNAVYFAQVAVACGTICWPQGEDFSPDTVAARMRGG